MACDGAEVVRGGWSRSDREVRSKGTVALRCWSEKATAGTGDRIADERRHGELDAR